MKRQIMTIDKTVDDFVDDLKALLTEGHLLNLCRRYLTAEKRIGVWKVGHQADWSNWLEGGGIQPDELRSLHDARDDALSRLRDYVMPMKC